MTESKSRFLDWYNCELGKFDPLLLWSALLEESGGEINGMMAKINQILSLENVSAEQEAEMVSLVIRCAQVSKSVFSQFVEDKSLLDNKPLYYFYDLLVDFVDWFSKKE